MVKTRILFFDSKNEARLKKVKVKDGMVDIEGKSYIVDASVPLHLKTRFGFVPLYILKWDSIVPATNINPAKLPATRVDPKFKTPKETKMTPELLKKLISLKILGNMITTPKKLPGGLIFMIIGSIVGMLIMYSIIYFKLI